MKGVSVVDYPRRISFKGQVTIPKKIRARLGIGTGDFVFFKEQGEEVVLKKVKLSPEEEFNQLVEVLDKKVKKLGITDKDIEEAIKWARKK